MTPYQKRILSPIAQRMAGDMCVRNLSQRTIDAYTYHVDRFARFFDKSLDQLGPEEIRTYQLHLIEVRKASWSRLQSGRLWPTLPLSRHSSQALGRAAGPLRQTAQAAALGVGLRRSQSVARMCTPAQTSHGSVDPVRSGTAAERSQSPATPRHRRPADADPHYERKRRKERLVPISPRLLHELREYWKADRPSNYLFPGKTEDVPLSSATVQKACKLAAALAGIHKSVTPHTLRHSYATGLLEAGVDLLTISRLLGHSSFLTTMVYLHVRRPHLESTPSPLDWLPVRQCPRWLDPNQAGPSSGPSNTPVNNNPPANSEPTPPPMPESGPAPPSA